ncbi:MAG: CerR family C-terminal domain-containing protein [Pseudomonadota bacterium]
MMRVKRKDGQETRANLLDAAARVFAEKGFHASTVSQICEAAGANVSSVSYYFAGKEELYVKAWQRALDLSLEKYPLDGGVPADAPAEERLRGHIRAVVARCADPDSLDFDIVHQDMAGPTGLLTDIMRQSLQPLREATTRLVRELMGQDASDQQVDLCHISIISQCIGYLMPKRTRHRLINGAGRCEHMAAEIDPEVFADHVFEFSLAGIRHVAASSGRGERG